MTMLKVSEIFNIKVQQLRYFSYKMRNSQISLRPLRDRRTHRSTMLGEEDTQMIIRIAKEKLPASISLREIREKLLERKPYLRISNITIRRHLHKIGFTFGKLAIQKDSSEFRPDYEYNYIYFDHLTSEFDDSIIVSYDECSFSNINHEQDKGWLSKSMGIEPIILRKKLEQLTLCMKILGQKNT